MDEATCLLLTRCATLFQTASKMIRVIRPFVNKRMAVNLAKEIFNLNINESSASVVRELNSPEARCFYLRGSLPYDEGREREFTLKVCKFADFGEERGIIDELNDVMIHVNAAGVSCSTPLQTSNGELYEMRKLSATRDCGTHPTTHTRNKGVEESIENFPLNCVVRLLSYIPGENMRGVPCDVNMFYQVGFFAAEIDKVLKDFYCPMLQTRSLRWDLNNLPMATRVSHIIKEPEYKEILHNVENIFENKIEPKLDYLPKQCIHADINETNIIFKENTDKYDAAGVIDFDLAAYNSRVFEVSASAAYMMTMHLEDPVEAGAYAVAGYQMNNPLTTEECNLIFYLIQARMYQSVCYGTLASQIHPQNSTYLLYTVQRAWKALRILADTSKSRFDERWQQLCYTQSQTVKSWGKRW